MKTDPDFDINNPAWKSLCDLTTDLAPKFDSRREAFAAACRQRPDLAAAATKKATPHQGQPQGESPLVRAAARERQAAADREAATRRA